MTDSFQPHEERELLAAELALGLLEGAELDAARTRFRADPAFAEAVEAWEARLSPLFDGIQEVAPAADVWRRIEQAIAGEGERASAAPSEPAVGNVLEFRRRERLWRGIAGGMTALAAALALVLGLRIAQPDAPVPQPAPQEAPAPTLVASVTAEDGTAALAVSFEPDRRTLLVTPTRLQPAAGHDHELWLIPASGTPVSLGLVRADTPQRVRVPESLSGAVAPAATVALSVEPTGGSPTGQPTGPIIATGALRQI